MRSAERHRDTAGSLRAGSIHPVKIAFTIGAYRLFDFIKLSALQLKRLSPDSPILISDDPAQESQFIKKFADENGIAYRGARQKRGHFGGDFQSFINALVFAEAHGCDVAVKASQRFIFRKPESIEAIRTAFSDPNIAVATPGRPTVTTSHAPATKGFAAFGTLSDVVAIRVGSITAETLLHLYRARIIRERVPWASFIECLVDELHSNVFPGRTVKLAEWTNPTADPIYLRRYQANERQYRDLALSHGFNGQFPLNEWGQIEQGAYMSKPVVI